MAEMIERTKVIGYVRVSTEQQASEGLSLDVQRARLRAYAEAMDLDLVRIEEDAGFSAKNLKRPALKSALAALDDGQASALLVVKLDRLTRRVLDLAHLIERYFGERFSLLSVADSIDTRTAGGRLVLNVMASAAQWERETISERVRDTIRHLREQGVRLGSPPFGWHWTGERNEHGRLVVSELPEEQKTIRRISQLRREGCTLDEVVTAITAEGLKPRGAKRWHSAVIRSILKRAEVPHPTWEQVLSRRKSLGVWWSTARWPAVAATEATVELALSLRQEGFSFVDIAEVLTVEGHTPVRGRRFHKRSVSRLFQNIDQQHLRRRANLRRGFPLGSELVTSGGIEPIADDGGDPMLARVIALRKEGHTLREIGARLCEEGCMSKRGGKWHPATLSQMLRKAKVAAPQRWPHGIDPFGLARAPSPAQGEQVEGLCSVRHELESTRRAVGLREQGLTMDRIAVTLNEEGRSTKLGYRWSSESVSRVLHRVLDYEPTRKALADTMRGRGVVFGLASDAKRGEDGRRQVRPIPSEQATIKRAVALRQSGCSLPEIAQRLNSEGRPTQRRRNWNTATVLKILRREGASHSPASILSGRVPYGWERASGLDPRGDRGLRPVPEEQATIRRMVKLRKQGRSLNEIATTAEREHRPTKYGGRWSSPTVAKVLSRADVAPPAHHPSRTVPFGWKWSNGADRREALPDPKEQRTLTRALTLWRRGYGARAIASALNREGRATRCGGPWHPATVQAIVRRARAGGLERDRAAPQAAKRQAAR